MEQPEFWGFYGAGSQEFGKPVNLIALEVKGGSPAALAGIRPGDQILTVHGQWAALQGVNDIWKRIPVGTDVEIKVLRDKQELVLHTVRVPAPVSMLYYTWWQFIGFLAFLFTAVFVLLGYPLPRLARPRGVVAGLLGLGVLVYLMVLVVLPTDPMWKLLRQEIPVSEFSVALNLWQKLAVGIGATALVLLGAFDFLRNFGKQATESKSSANEIKLGTENLADKLRPGFLRHVVVPMLILLVLCSAIGTLCIAMFEKKDDAVLRMCWRVGSIVVPVAAALLLVRWARLRGIAGSIGAFALRSISLRSWTWPLAALVLVPAAIYVPRPGDLPEPAEVEKIFHDMILAAPEGGSYRFYSFFDPEWKKARPVYDINRATTTNQQVTRTLGWDAKDGASLGFFHRSATWKYKLSAMQFGDNRDTSKPLFFSDEELAKLRPHLLHELDMRDIAPLNDPSVQKKPDLLDRVSRSAVLEDILDHGREVSTVVCWQNGVVLLAWLSLPLAVLTLIWKLREVFVACVGALGFALAVANELAGPPNNLDWFAIPLMIVAAVGVVILLVLHHFEKPPGIRASLPVFTLIVLGAGAGALPWVMAFVAPIPGWHLWHGVAFSLVYFALLLIHLIASDEKFARLRALSLLAGGLAVIVLAFICTTWPPVVPASINGAPTTFTANVVLPGLLLAENLAFLTAIIGAVQLRQGLAAKQNAGTRETP
jgi:hypothetical protein